MSTDDFVKDFGENEGNVNGTPSDIPNVPEAELPTEGQATDPVDKKKTRVPKPRSIPLENIAIGDFHVRDKESEDTIEDYSYTFVEYMEKGGDYPFPAVNVLQIGKDKYALVTGHHRYLAAKRAGMKKIHARVFTGTEDEARRLALRDNSKNGHRMTPKDKRAAIMQARAWSPGASVRELVEMTDIPKSTIQDILSKENGASKTGPQKKTAKKAAKKAVKAVKKTAKKTSRSGNDLEVVLQGLKNEDLPVQFSKIRRLLETFEGTLQEGRDRKDFWKYLKTLLEKKISL